MTGCFPWYDWTFGGAASGELEIVVGDQLVELTPLMPSRLATAAKSSPAPSR